MSTCGAGGILFGRHIYENDANPRRLLWSPLLWMTALRLNHRNKLWSRHYLANSDINSTDVSSDSFRLSLRGHDQTREQLNDEHGGDWSWTGKRLWASQRVLAPTHLGQNGAIHHYEMHITKKAQGLISSLLHSKYKLHGVQFIISCIYGANTGLQCKHWLCDTLKHMNDETNIRSKKMGCCCYLPSKIYIYLLSHEKTAHQRLMVIPWNIEPG